MKITEILKQRKFIFSCEFFPPKTEEGMAQLFEAAQELKELDPGYVSVTYGAGGSTRGKTVRIVQRIKYDFGIESMAHLTCVGHSRDELKAILDHIRDAGIENVIALRGDPPKGQTDFVPHPDGFRYAADLVRMIRESYPFCVAVGGYPEGHPESTSLEEDWDRLAEKVRAGADLVITQLFFDNADFFRFEKRMREKGVNVPIIPGIMPITNYGQIVRFTQMCGAKIPPQVARDLEPIQNDAEAVAAYGVEFATKQCEELIRRGVPGLHFYTLNKSKSTKKIIQNLKRSAF
jgi:methylenetetrahydrofolate reductase (NADPH)